MLLWLMNLDFSGGAIAIPPIPPNPSTGGGGGSANIGSKKHQQERTRQFEEENKFIEQFLKMVTDILNNQ